MIHFRLQRHLSPVGEMLLVSDDEGRLRALDFGDYESRLHRLLRLHYRHYVLDDLPVPIGIVQRLSAYFGGELSAIDDIPVATEGTAFQRAVWSALRSIPVSSTTTYGALAKVVGRPGASRAVGLANGANPIAIVVPCHRVIGADGNLTGYGGGLPRKRWLLQHECQHIALCR
ncbi:MAG: methylated-DNA--[protein]-cysteine S-methyltransferase [bacterium]